MEPAGKGDGAARAAKERRDSLGDDVDQCAVCFTTFDLALRRPRTLPCGHIFCTVCIDRLIDEESQVPCPTCSKEHPVPESGMFPVCYNMEDVLRKLQDAALVSPQARLWKDTAQSGASTLTGPAGGQNGKGKEIRSLLLKQETKFQAALFACQQKEAQLARYQATLTDWVERQQHLEDRLQDLLDQSRGATALVQHEKSQAGAKKEQRRNREEQLHALLNSLRKATKGEEAIKAINDAEIATDKEREQLGDFPDVRTVSVFSKVREASSAAVEAAATVQAAQEGTDNTPSGAARDSRLQAATASSITDRLETLLAPSLKEREAPTRAVRGTQTEGKEPETAVRGTQTEGMRPRTAVLGTQTDGKEPETRVRGTQTEGMKPRTAVRGTETKGKEPETPVQSSDEV